MKETASDSCDSANIAQLKKYAEDLSRLYKAGKNKGKDLDRANSQLMEYADALNRTITELKGKSEKLAALALELSVVEERERSIIAEDIHDHIGQMLAMAKVQLHELSKSAAKTDKARLNEIEGLIQQAISYSRSLMFEISPNALLELGFVEAVEWLVEHINDKYHLDIKYSHCEKAGPLDDNASIILFKAIRELLINIVKHAQADTAYVSVENTRDSVCVTVRDEGTGYSPSEMHTVNTGKMKFGLFNMQQRILHAGGSIDIDSSIGRGTSVLIAMPHKMSATEREQTR